MNQVVTLTACETKSGSSSKGPWTRYEFRDAGGNKYQTFNAELGQMGQSLIGKNVEVEWGVESRQGTDRDGNPKTFENNVLSAIRETQQAITAAAPQQTSAQSSGGSYSDSEKAVMRRIRAYDAAVATVAAGVESAEGGMSLFPIADLIATYYERGSDAFAPPEDQRF